MMNSKKNRNWTGWFAALGILLAAGVAAGQPAPEDFLPTAQVGIPALNALEARILSPTFTVTVLGTDPDGAEGRPAKYRVLLVSAQYDEIGGVPQYIRTAAEYAQHGEELVQWHDPLWSEWLDYPGDGSDPTVTFVALEDGESYLFAVQTMDAHGAVSTGRRYQREVANLTIRAGFYRPEVVLSEPFLGTSTASAVSYEIAAGQPLNFHWTASAEAYAGEIVSYRHGWDLVDPNDPLDPGWEVPPGTGPQNLYANERAFNEGIHMFHLRVVDDAGQVRHMTRTLQVIPFVEISMQRSLLLIDQVHDDNVNTWPDASGFPRDHESYRDAYWTFVGDASGGIEGFDPARDWADEQETVRYSDVVAYRTVLCYARSHVDQTLMGQFRPVNDQDRFVWLGPYQQRGGNLFLVGGASMKSFLEPKTNLVVPTVFDTRETFLLVDGIIFETGFGQAEMPDGSLVERGPRMYPYATAGVAALDWTSPPDRFIYGRTTTAYRDREADCVGLKGLALDPAFKQEHLIGPGVLPDTMRTDATIDWQDALGALAGTLALDTRTFPFRHDEFVNANISPRVTPIINQACPDGPSGACVEPMWRGIARLDWMREYYRLRGDPGWPSSQFSETELETACGPLALTDFEGQPASSARTNGRTFGYLSWKNVADKPSGKADVYWGFDPYRFDHDQTQRAVRWVLQYMGLQVRP